jgi:hypothetical protein
VAEELSKSRLQWVRRELDQVGVAMSVVGTSRPMLRRMAKLLQPSIDGLRGERPEIKKLRDDLKRAQHNLESGPTTPLRSSRNMEVARDLMDQVIRLSDKGLLGLPEKYDEGRIELENVWGYTRDELKVFRGLLRQALADLSDVGLYDKLAYGNIRLHQDDARGDFLTRNRQQDVFVVDPSRGRSKADIFVAFGDRLWDKIFKPSDRQTWGDRTRFSIAFVKALRGQPLDSEDRARLQVTVGRIAGDEWPGMAA